MDDEFFGEQAIFRESAEITVPYIIEGSATEMTLDIQFQGCADIGLCYPPANVTLPVTLPVGQPAQPTGLSASRYFDKSQGLDKALNRSVFGTASVQEELLPPERAYLPQIVQADEY